MAYLARIFLSPLQESDVVQLTALVNVRLQAVALHVFADGAHLTAEGVAVSLVLERGLALDLSEHLGPHVLEHLDLAHLRLYLSPERALNVYDSIIKTSETLSRLLTFTVGEQERDECLLGVLDSHALGHLSKERETSFSLRLVHDLLGAAPSAHSLTPFLRYL